MMMWVAAAAAILVVGVGAIVYVQQLNQPSDYGTTGIITEMDKSSDQPMPVLEEKTIAMASPAKPGTPAVKEPSVKSELLVAEGSAKPVIVADAIALSDIDATPPFAPASAIELVTLPRRDELQLTIYNSADLTLVRERRNLTLKRGETGCN
jgi:hypothetical protein